MDIEEALETLGILDINSVTGKSLTKIYRSLMKKNHPDIGGNEDQAKNINSAYEAVKDLCKQLDAIRLHEKDKNEKTCLIGFDSFLDIYQGKKISIKFEDGVVELSKANIWRFNILLNTTLTLEIQGNNYTYNKVFSRNLDDTYNFVCNVKVNSLEDIIYIKIKAYNKEIPLEISKSNITLNLNFGYGINLKVFIERQLTDNGDK